MADNGSIGGGDCEAATGEDNEAVAAPAIAVAAAVAIAVAGAVAVAVAPIGLALLAVKLMDEGDVVTKARWLTGVGRIGITIEILDVISFVMPDPLDPTSPVDGTSAAVTGDLEDPVICDVVATGLPPAPAPAPAPALVVVVPECTGAGRSGAGEGALPSNTGAALVRGLLLLLLLLLALLLFASMPAAC